MKQFVVVGVYLALGVGLSDSALGQALRAVPHRGAAANVGEHSGRVQHWRASYYGREFDGHRMANGRPFHPASQTAASKTLPLGTTVRVTNLQNGHHTMVLVEDRGPRARDRVLDVSPQAARQLDMQRGGVVPVSIAPVEVPQPDGSVKLGAGATPRATSRAPKTSG